MGLEFKALSGDFGRFGMCVYCVLCKVNHDSNRMCTSIFNMRGHVFLSAAVRLPTLSCLDAWMYCMLTFAADRDHILFRVGIHVFKGLHWHGQACVYSSAHSQA